VHRELYVRTVPWYVKMDTCTYTCTGIHYVPSYTMYVHVYVSVYYVRTINAPWYLVPWYHGTRDWSTVVHVPWYVPWYVRTYQWYVRVRTYVLIMLCHNFLIGKGHTCALRTTCVLGGTRVRTRVRTNITLSQKRPNGTRVYRWYGTSTYTCTNKTLSQKRKNDVNTSTQLVRCNGDTS
jgi:hypothetical protein